MSIKRYPTVMNFSTHYTTLETLKKSGVIWSLKTIFYILNTGRGTWTRIPEEIEVHNPKCLFSLEHKLQTFVACVQMKHISTVLCMHVLLASVAIIRCSIFFCISIYSMVFGTEFLLKWEELNQLKTQCSLLGLAVRAHSFQWLK